MKKAKPGPKPRTGQANQPSSSNPTPPKEPAKEAAGKSKDQVKEPIDIASQSPPPSEKIRPAIGTPHAEDPMKLYEEHISLGTKTRADSNGEATETSSSVGTPEKAPRGRKLERKKREEKSYRDVTTELQQTISDMMETRSTKKGKASKGATPPPSSS